METSKQMTLTLQSIECTMYMTKESVARLVSGWYPGSAEGHSRVHPTKSILYVNSVKYKIFKNHKQIQLEVLQFLKPKDKILIDI